MIAVVLAVLGAVVVLRLCGSTLRPAPYTIAQVYAGAPTVEHVVPPAGERYAFDRKDWPVNVQVTVSPSGSTVQVHVNGERVWMQRGRRV
jgi:hypothetical protein